MGTGIQSFPCAFTLSFDVALSLLNRPNVLKGNVSRFDACTSYQKRSFNSIASEHSQAIILTLAGNLPLKSVGLEIFLARLRPLGKPNYVCMFQLDVLKYLSCVNISVNKAQHTFFQKKKNSL